MDVMWREVGVLRSEPGLRRGLAKLGALRAALLETGVADANPAFNLSWHDWLNLRNLIEVSEVITRAALDRENSRGAHFREDFPHSGTLNPSHFTVARARTGQPEHPVEVTQQPVAFTIVKPGESLVVKPNGTEPNGTE